MQNLFYVPPVQPHQAQHPKPLGVKTVIKRGAPERLEFVDSAYWTPPVKTYAPEVRVVPTHKPRKTLLQSLRHALGRFFIRLGDALIPDETMPLGQPE